MRRSRSTPEQIIRTLRQVEAGQPVKDMCRQVGISEQTFYRWKKQYGDLGVSELRELLALCPCSISYAPAKGLFPSLQYSQSTTNWMISHSSRFLPLP